MVVVVKDRDPLWAWLAVVSLVLVAIGILLFFVSGERGTVFVIALPGFPVESIIIGLVIGICLVVLKRGLSK